MSVTCSSHAIYVMSSTRQAIETSSPYPCTAYPYRDPLYMYLDALLM